MQDIDWKAVMPVAGIALIAGAALGVFLIAPQLEKARAKDKAKKEEKNLTAGAKK